MGTSFHWFCLLASGCPPNRVNSKRRGGDLAAWTQEAEASGSVELQGFVRSIRQDWAAVVAGLSQEISNGQTEGQVNRLKTIKRQMYGRANFDLLRKRVLHAA